MKKIVSLFLTVLFFTTLQSQTSILLQTVKGTVADEQSGKSLPGAEIRMETKNGNFTVITDENGFFKFTKIPIGRQQLKISKMGFEDRYLQNIEITSSKEVVLEINIKERVKKQEDVIIKSGKSKKNALNEAAVVSARQLSIEEAFRYSGTRNDPSRMAQNFAGVSGSNDARNDIVIRGNSPSGVLWRMDGIDMPNPNHFSTLGATGGPVSMLNINTLKNSDFLTGAFPAHYGNATAGVFDLKMRNGNTEKNEFLGQMGFNGFEFGAEGPIAKKNKSSYLVNYRYSMVASLQKLGLQFGTGSATPYYQDATFKIHLPTKKSGTFSFFGLGGESHIRFLPESQGKDNLYSSNDGSTRDRNFKSLTGMLGFTHTYFFTQKSSGKFMFSATGLSSHYSEVIVDPSKPDKPAFDKKSDQLKYTAGYLFNTKISAKQQFTTAVYYDWNNLKLKQDYIKDGDSVLSTIINSKENAGLLRAFANYSLRFNDQLSTNFGLYYQQFILNQTNSLEPRWNLKYQFAKKQSISLGAGLHSQTQPLEIYFYQTANGPAPVTYTNRNLKMVKSLQGVIGYDNNISRHFRFKTELYAQYIYNAAVENFSSTFSMLNTGADFGFPDKTNLVNNGKGYNFGTEITVERFLDKGFYCLFTGSLFSSKYKGSDRIWRSTAFNSNYVLNALAGKEIYLNEKTSFGVDTKITLTGGQRYTPFDLQASKIAGFVIYQTDKAYSLQNSPYFRLDVKLSYTRNLKKVTQKWYIDLQNLTGRENIYIRTLQPKTSVISQINQIGFFPNINYLITF